MIIKKNSTFYICILINRLLLTCGSFRLLNRCTSTCGQCLYCPVGGALRPTEEQMWEFPQQLNSHPAFRNKWKTQNQGRGETARIHCCVKERRSEPRVRRTGHEIHRETGRTGRVFTEACARSGGGVGASPAPSGGHAHTRARAHWHTHTQWKPPLAGTVRSAEEPRNF